jgi:hypothetical protein
MVTVASPRKFDFKSTPHYRAARAPAFVEVPPTDFLSVEGEGEPGAGAFQSAIEALYPVAYALKFAFKERGRFDWVVPPLEALWWSADGDLRSANRDPQRLRWRAMLAQPEVVRSEDVELALEAASRRRELPALASIRFLEYDEGTSAQVLHVGPYSQEEATIRRLHEFIAERRRTPRLLHHEIYLSNPGRTPPERLRTIIRQPVA